MTNHLKVLCLLATSALAVSCSIRFFGSEEEARIAVEKYIVEPASTGQASAVYVGSGESRKLLFARMCARQSEENKFVCEERKPKNEEMTLKEWENLKVSYLYFHYW